MNSTRPAGAYIADMNGDDGIRLYVDNTLYFNRWVEQSNTVYSKQLFPLTGNSVLRFDYYESTGQNDVGFNNFFRVSNAVATAGGSVDTSVCNNVSVTLNGNNTFTAAPISSTAAFTVTYQWSVSTNNGVSFTNIAGATSQNYTTSSLTAGTYYYRRTANVSRSNDGTPSNIAVSVPDNSNTVKVTVRLTPAISTTGGGNVCRNSPANILVTNLQALPVAITYSYSGAVGTGTGSLNVGASASATLPFPTNTVGATTITLNTIAYSNSPACSTTVSGQSVIVKVLPLPNGVLSSNSPICKGVSGKLIFTASAGTAPYALAVNGQIYTGITSGTAFNITPLPVATTLYEVTKITDANGCSNP